jgi:3-deoxy-7-phosphoheptulonate synthase
MITFKPEMVKGASGIFLGRFFNIMFRTTDDLRVITLKPLIPPAILHEELPISRPGLKLVSEARRQATKIIRGKDRRLLAIVGPCSIHDTKAALEYAGLLREQAVRFSEDLLVIMRVYFEKPRTSMGWKGLINDPRLDGSFDINSGLRAARRLLLDLVEMGVGAATEFLDTITPQFIVDLITWGAIGARTTESQVHRELASGLSVPVGFKNGTDGSIQVAMDAIKAALHPHHFLGVTKQGIAAIVATRGNDVCHVILRGSDAGVNYNSAHIRFTADALRKNHISTKIMVDCSHGNSNKDYHKQPMVASDLAQQIQAGEQSICGFMLESHLVEGKQGVSSGRTLVYGQSVTDACISWKDTVPILEEMALAVARKRRAGKTIRTGNSRAR